MVRRLRPAALVAALLTAPLALSCGGSSGQRSPSPLGPSGTVYATTSTNALVTFSAATPSVIVSSTPMTGLQPGETIVGLDIRTGTGDLLVLGSTGQLYRLDPASAAATPFGAAPFAVVAGVAFGFDVDPDTDQIHVVSDADDNVRASAATGASLGAHGALVYAPGDPGDGQDPTIVALAYTADSAGSGVATAYGIDATLGTLVHVGGIGGGPSPSTGLLFTVGSLGVSTTAESAFDIAAGSGQAYAALGAPASSFYRIDLGTGAATLVGAIGPVAMSVTAMSVVAEEAPRMLALTAAGDLITFRANAPGTILSTVVVSGLVGLGETLVGLDVRPSTGQFYAVSSGSRLYRIEPATGVATPLGAPGAFALAGVRFGLDFDPTTDRLRVVSDADQNLVLDPDDATLVSTDATLQYAALDPNVGQNPGVVACAYTNASPESATTRLYGIDSDLDVLVTQDPAAEGTLQTVGPLGTDTGGFAAFDVLGGTAQAYGAFTPPLASSSGLFRVSLGTGHASFVGVVGGGSPIVGLAVHAEAVVTILVVDAGHVLHQVDARRPSTPTAPAVTITGLAFGEVVVGLDTRPATGEVFLLGSASRLYTLDLATGVATAVGAPGAFLLLGTSFGFAFDPTSDRIRVTSDLEQNLLLHPDGSLVSVDAPLAYAVGDLNFAADPTIVASAHTGHAGASTTTLYELDAALGVLVTRSPPAAGTLTTVGAIGVALAPGASVGFDLDPDSGRAYVAGTVVGDLATRLFVVRLATGQLVTVGNLPGAFPARGIAVRR